MTTVSSPASEVFRQIGDLFASPAFAAALPVLIDAVKKVEADSSLLKSPAFGAQFVADLTATLPAIDASATQGAVAALTALVAAVEARTPPEAAKATSAEADAQTAVVVQ